MRESLLMVDAGDESAGDDRLRLRAMVTTYSDDFYDCMRSESPD